VHNFAEYRQRLAHHGKRLSALGVSFYRSPQVAWSASRGSGVSLNWYRARVPVNVPVHAFLG